MTIYSFVGGVALWLTTLPVTQAQRIEIIKPERTGKDIVLTRPTFSARPEAIPAENGLYRFTHYLVVACNDDQSGEGGEVSQYLNINNGLIGFFPDNLLTMTKGQLPTGDGEIDFWAILPSMTQRMFIKSPERGKMLVQMTAGDGMQTTTTARFDAWNQGDMFWRTAKVIKKTTLPARLIEGNAKPIPVEIYEATGPEGRVNVWLIDLGLATGQYAPLKTNHAAVGMGGIGLLMNHFNKHVYLVFQVNDVPNTKGCRLVTFYPKARQFSGAGYKPFGDLMLDKLADAQREQQKEQAEQLAADDEETDAQLRELRRQARELGAAMQKKVADGATNAAMLNDLSEVNRTTMAMATNVDDQYKMADIELKIARRRLEIELDQMREDSDPEAEKRRRAIREKMRCGEQQRVLWQEHRQNAAKLKKQFEGRETDYDCQEKMGQLSTRFYTRLAQVCR
ncbi:hypothetical protein ACAW74_01910 [Fibrella sp. WM1]|uniref:hypothetical protein n=1 Tax=Fibrella musci TaxID=3242485 RepID=UPI0035216077